MIIVSFDQQMRKKTRNSPRTPQATIQCCFWIPCFPVPSIVKLDNMGRSTLDQCESRSRDHKMYLFWYYTLICDTASLNVALPAPSISSTSSLVFDTSQPINSAWRGRSSSSVQTVFWKKVDTPDSSKNGMGGDWNWWKKEQALGVK